MIASAKGEGRTEGSNGRAPAASEPVPTQTNPRDTQSLNSSLRSGMSGRFVGAGRGHKRSAPTLANVGGHLKSQSNSEFDSLRVGFGRPTLAGRGTTLPGTYHCSETRFRRIQHTQFTTCALSGLGLRKRREMSRRTLMHRLRLKMPTAWGSNNDTAMSAKKLRDRRMLPCSSRPPFWTLTPMRVHTTSPCVLDVGRRSQRTVAKANQRHIRLSAP